jgi:SAM-dependent methyltransferase
MNAVSTYQKFAQYYDFYVNDFTEDLACYKAFCRPQDKILEVGCGTGRVLNSFLTDGFQITGVDISQEMLAVAAAKLATFAQQGHVTLQCHNFLDKPLAEQYDTVLVTFYTFNYILENPHLFLKNIFLSMSADARLLMDFFYPKTLAHKELDNVWSSHTCQAGDRTITLRDKRTYANGLEERVQIYEEQGGTTEITSLRKYYPPAAVKQLLEVVGFQQIRFAAHYDRNLFNEILNSDNLTRNFLVAAVKKS